MELIDLYNDLHDNGMNEDIESDIAAHFENVDVIPDSAQPALTTLQDLGDDYEYPYTIAWDAENVILKTAAELEFADDYGYTILPWDNLGWVIYDLLTDNA